MGDGSNVRPFKSSDGGDMAETTTVVVTESGQPYAQILNNGRHRLVADEPVDVGGRDAGPSPYELLLMALGSCTAITVRMYANRKGWPMTGITVRLEHFRGHAADAEAAEDPAAFLDRIDRRIELDGPLDEGQRAKLMQIAGSCPVHRTLSHRTLINTTLSTLAVD